MRQTGRGLLHVLLGAAAAAALTAIGVGMTITFMNAGTGGRVVTALLIAVSMAAVTAVLLAPPIRVAEASMARLLLDPDLPTLTESRDRESRVNGLVWAAIVVGVSGLCLLCVLFLAPFGAGLLSLPFIDEPIRMAGWSADPDRSTRWLLAPLGLLSLAAIYPVIVASVRVLRRWAPTWLKPTAQEQLDIEHRRNLDLARANELARNLHDTIGHALTAIGIQAEAGVLATDRDRDATRAAFTAIRDVAHGAVADLDTVLGVLRSQHEASRERLADVHQLVARLPTGAVELVAVGDLDAVTGEVSDAAFRIVQEAITNGLRHGTGPVRVSVSVMDEAVGLVVRNRFTASCDAPSTRTRGLIGMRERAHLVGGALTAAGHGDVWMVRGDLPRSQR